MTPDQAQALLELMADLYRIVKTGGQGPPVEVNSNGHRPEEVLVT